MSQFMLQTFRRFTYVTTHSPTLPSFHLRHSSCSKPSVVSPTSQLILQPFRSFIYVTAHVPNLPSLHLRRSSFSNTFIASPTSQLMLLPFHRFTYDTWRAAHGIYQSKSRNILIFLSRSLALKVCPPLLYGVYGNPCSKSPLLSSFATDCALYPSIK